MQGTSISGMFTLGGLKGMEYGGQTLEYKMMVGMSKAQKPACVGSLMAKMEQNLHRGRLDC